MTDYYERVGAYFDQMTPRWEERYWTNTAAQRIRQAFREEVKRLPWRTALEVGCGTGLDLAHFGTIYPEREVVGIDVSPRMVEVARRCVAASRARGDVRVEQADAEGAPELAGPEAFDLCYVFFGALNTVEDLHRVADRLYEAVRPGGHLVLTCVNRWYLAEVLISLARGRWRFAFERYRPTWNGYTPERPMPGRCYSPPEVRRAFGRAGRLVRRRGFSIAYPAWYRTHWLGRLGRWGGRLWDLDRMLSRTPLWSCGEYALYVFRKADHPRA